MTMKIRFDPMAVNAKDLLKAIEALGVKPTDVTLHHGREAKAEKGKAS